MNISGFVAYVKQAWKNKPDTSTPINAERLGHMEDGIKGGSDAIEKIAAAVVSQIVNDPNKVASMAALYAVNQAVTKNANDITSLNSKFPNDRNYFAAVIPRINDYVSDSSQPSLRADIEFMIKTKGIKSGEYGFYSTQYNDLPSGIPKWGYVKYFQHADNYVTVMVFPDGLTGGILINQFILDVGQWNSSWKKFNLTDVL